MDAEILDGSAFTLFGAYEERPSLRGLNKLLFTSGPHPKEVIEITGEAGSGKSYILLDLLAKCLLPREQNGLSVGGMGSGAVLLNADQHLNLFRLVRMMEVRVRRRLKELDEAQIEDIISTSLKRLAVLDVFSEEELALALRSARNHIFFNSDVSLIALDSIAANFWSTAAQCGMRKFDSYVEDTLKSIRHLIADFKITLLYTRPAYFFSKSGLPSELSLNYDLGNVNTRIVLKGSSVKRAEVHSGSSVHIAFYECSENGVQWTK